MNRRKKITIIQSVLFFFAIILIYFTYYKKGINNEENIISKSIKEKIEKQIKESETTDADIFYDVEYTGLDLNGNRYLLKSKEAQLDELKPEVIYMKTVHSIFYFKDGTILYVWSDEGIYNSSTLDMKFEENVRAEYSNSKLFADNAEYSNSKNFLSIYNNVKIDDVRGNMIADKLLFDISNQMLDITSFNNGKINANVNLNEKSF